MQLATVRPPPAVQAAFNEVNQAQQEKQTAINQAWAIYNDAVPNARGQAKEREKQAEAYAFRRVNRAKGDTEKFSLLLDRIRESAGDHAAAALFRIDGIDPARARAQGRSWTTASKAFCKPCRSCRRARATPAAQP